MRIVRVERGFTLIEMLAVIAVIGILSAVALPMTDSARRGYQVTGAAKGISTMISLAKMRATARFSRARVYADLATNTYSLQIRDRDTGNWVTEGGVRRLPSGVAFGFAGLTDPPQDTQDAIAHRECLDDSGDQINGTACVVFNSRGLPVDGNDVSNDNAIYITNGESVYATTVTATPLIRTWWSPANGAAWHQQ